MVMTSSKPKRVDLESTSHILKIEDPANRVCFLKGLGRLSLESIGPNEWLEIVNHVLGLCRPYLKYLQFSPIGDSLSRLPEGVSPRTRCREIFRNLEKTTEWTLFITQEGKWLQRERRGNHIEVIELTEDGILDLLGRSKYLGVIILNFFSSLVAEGAKKREERLQKLERLKEDLVDIQERVAW